MREFLRERVCVEDFAFPQIFPLPGIARFRKWNAKEVLYELADTVMSAEPLLRELFLMAPNIDPLTRLEWAEVLSIADQVMAV